MSKKKKQADEWRLKVMFGIAIAVFTAIMIFIG